MLVKAIHPKLKHLIPLQFFMRTVSVKFTHVTKISIFNICIKK